MIKAVPALFIALTLVTEATPVHAQTENAFVTTSLALYQPDDVLRQRIGNDVIPLSSYVKALQAAAAGAFASVPRSSGVTGSIVVAVKPGGLSRFWLVLGENKLPEGLQSSLLKDLSSISPVAVSNGPIAVAINFTAWGGGKPILSSKQPVPIPDEWRNAMRAEPAGVIPDAPLRRVWP